jgi:hypothetical protein
MDYVYIYPKNWDGCIEDINVKNVFRGENYKDVFDLEPKRFKLSRREEAIMFTKTITKLDLLITDAELSNDSDELTRLQELKTKIIEEMK